MTRTHIDRRYSQAEAAFKAMQPNPFTPEGLARLRSAEYRELARRKAEQMSRITHRCQRMMGAL